MGYIKPEWLERYNNLKEFYTEKNRFPKYSEIYKGSLVGSWYNNQKNLYKTGRLNEDKINLLNKINPLWFSSVHLEINKGVWRDNIKEGEHSLDIVVKEKRILERYINRGMYSVEDYYRYNLKVEKNAFNCTSACAFLFKGVPFYYLRILSVMYKDKDLLDLDNLKTILDKNTQKKIKNYLGNLIRKLPSEYILILNMKYRDDLKISKIARDLKMSQEDIKKKLVVIFRKFLSSNESYEIKDIIYGYGVQTA